MYIKFPKNAKLCILKYGSFRFKNGCSYSVFHDFYLSITF